MIEVTPALLAAQLRRSAELEERIAQIIAEREGVDIDADPPPSLLVAPFNAVIRVTQRRWSAGDDLSIEANHELTMSYLDQVGPALTSNWACN